MGYGTIVSGGTDGLYTVALDFGTSTRDELIAALDDWISRVNVQIADAEEREAVAAAEAAGREGILQALIGELTSGPTPDDTVRLMAEIDIATARYAQAQARADAIRIPRELLLIERKEMVAKKNALQSAVIERTVQAWCVDLTQDATGQVATIEVPGEDQKVLIAPGGRGWMPTDGFLFARDLMSPAQAFFNAAILPGWQKWKPTYRSGTITFLDFDANLANVSLDSATSSAAGLALNQTPTLSGVAVEYMECAASAFDVGDRVVVAFDGQDWTQPRVIGFVDHPKPCLWAFVATANSPSFTQVIIKALRPDVVADLWAGTPQVTVFFSGLGPYYAGPGPFVLEGGSYGASYTVTTPSIPPGSEDMIQLYASIAFIPPADLEGDLLAEFPHGYVGIFVTPPYAYIYDPDRTDTGEKNITEFLVTLGGETILHFAATDAGWLGFNRRQEVDVKGVPFQNTPGLYPVHSALAGYEFQLG